MNKMIEIRVEMIVNASRFRVWEVLSDHESMIHWTRHRKVTRRRPGVPYPNGVGAVRALSGLREIEERVTLFEPCQRLEYDVIRGAPGAQTHGCVTLTPTVDGGTLIWWRVQTRPYIPGTGRAIERFLESALQADLRRLKERVEPELLTAVTGVSEAQTPSYATHPRIVMPGFEEEEIATPLH